MNKDTVVGILGAVILVAAMVGIFYYEGTQSPGTVAVGSNGPGGPGTGVLNVTSIDGPTVQGGGGSLGTPDAAKNVTIKQQNLTAADFTLTWSDPQTGPVQMVLKLTGPQGQSGTGTGGTGLKIHMALNNTAGGSNGVGDWKVEVTSQDNTPGGVCAQAGTLPVPNPACSEPTWSLASKLSFTKAS